jgi:hypothetical protein
MSAMRWRAIGALLLLVVVAATTVAWILHAGPVDHWLGVHTGTVNESGPYYGFWSGFGSDLAEFSILGAIGTGAYQLVRKYNCHVSGCWRIGSHPAAGGQFMLCYRHHPDLRGKRPSLDLIERSHAQHVARQDALLRRLHDVHGLADPTSASGDARVAADAAASTASQPAQTVS